MGSFDLPATCIEPIVGDQRCINTVMLFKSALKDILKNATVIYEDGLISCLTAPAVVSTDGRAVWLYRGKLHRGDGPVFTCSRISIWAKLGKFHRLDGPAILTGTDGWVWCLHGKIHREGGPAVQAPPDTIYPRLQELIKIVDISFEDPQKPKHLHQEWWTNGKRHRLDGPAIKCNICADNYWVDGKVHRVDGPAVICKYGSKYYYKDGILIKSDVSAREFVGGVEQYPSTGIQLSTCSCTPARNLSNDKQLSVGSNAPVREPNDDKQLALTGKRIRDGGQDTPEITISYFGNDIDLVPTQRRKVGPAEELTEDETIPK